MILYKILFEGFSSGLKSRRTRKNQSTECSIHQGGIYCKYPDIGVKSWFDFLVWVLLPAQHYFNYF